MTTTNNSVFAVVYRSLNAWEAQLMQQTLRSERIESFLGIPLFFTGSIVAQTAGIPGGPS